MWSRKGRMTLNFEIRSSRPESRQRCIVEWVGRRQSDEELNEPSWRRKLWGSRWFDRCRVITRWSIQVKENGKREELHSYFWWGYASVHFIGEHLLLRRHTFVQRWLLQWIRASRLCQKDCKNLVSFDVAYESWYGDIYIFVRSGVT